LIKKNENDFKIMQKVIELGNIFGVEEKFCYSDVSA